MKEITQTQKSFLENYATSLNIRHSAIEGGYSDKVALQQGKQLLKKEKYQNELNKLIEAKIDHLEITKAFIIKKYLQLIDWASATMPAEEGFSAKLQEGAGSVLRDFKRPNDPMILLRALDGMTRFLERDKENEETDTTSPFSQISGVNCEKL